MKLKLALKAEGSKISAIINIDSRGTYVVNFNSKKVEFFEDIALLFPDTSFLEFSFKESMLTPRNGDDKIMSHQILYLEMPVEKNEKGKNVQNTINLEYLELTSGEKIPSPKQKKNIQEVMLSVDDSCIGEVYGFEKIHEPLSKKFLILTLCVN